MTTLFDHLEPKPQKELSAMDKLFMRIPNDYKNHPLVKVLLHNYKHLQANNMDVDLYRLDYPEYDIEAVIRGLCITEHTPRPFMYWNEWTRGWRITT